MNKNIKKLEIDRENYQKQNEQAKNNINKLNYKKQRLKDYSSILNKLFLAGGAVLNALILMFVGLSTAKFIFKIAVFLLSGVSLIVSIGSVILAIKQSCNNYKIIKKDKQDQLKKYNSELDDARAKIEELDKQIFFAKRQAEQEYKRPLKHENLALEALNNGYTEKDASKE